MSLPPAFFSRELWRIERDIIEGAVAACGGSVPKAARILGVSPSTLYRKRDSWELPSRH
jgi:two-component system repressor protein LuxO